MDVAMYRQLVADAYPVIVGLVILYLLLVRVGQSLMETRKGFHLKSFLIGWNSALALFSSMGSLVTLSTLVKVVTRHGLEHSICSYPHELEGLNEKWLLFFVLSKIVELGDTVFLILRKRPVIFLHWYHHASAMLFVWYTFRVPVGTSQWGTAMNYTVHAFMYAYFAARAAGVVPPRWVSIVITSMQIVQMMIGAAICYYVAVKIYITGAPCVVPHDIAIMQVVVYTSLLFLFLRFFKKAYLGGGYGKKKI
jgi:hypothetical protein